MTDAIAETLAKALAQYADQVEDGVTGHDWVSHVTEALGEHLKPGAKWVTQYEAVEALVAGASK